MIWIASYPRSGNTFLRNIFLDIYGLESTSFPKEGKHNESIDYKITKTHMLPSLIPDLKEEDFVIYLVRDGRDAFISNSFYGKNILKLEGDFHEITYQQIMASKGAYFGGWSKNVVEWSKRANLIIRFEDLTTEPEKWLQKIASMLDFPEPDTTKIKTFEELKSGIPKYGSGSAKLDQKEFVQKFFRKGKIGSYKEEMRADHQKLFWQLHGTVMEQLGYSKNGDIGSFEQNIVRIKSPFVTSLNMQIEKARAALKRSLTND